MQRSSPHTGRYSRLQMMVFAGLLCAVGIVIPVLSPLKITLEPASFTLASHVAIFIGCFLSPAVGLAVAFGTTLGFLFAGFPLVVVMRALTHVVFAPICGFAVRRRPELARSVTRSLGFSLLIGLLHAACEVLIVLPFYFSNSLTEGYYAKGFVLSVLLLVGVGSVLHSMVDYALSVWIWKALNRAIA